MVTAPPLKQVPPKARISPLVQPVAVGIKAGKGRVAKATTAAKVKAVVAAVNGRGETLGNATNVSAAAMVGALGNPTLQVVMAEVVLAVTVGAGLARCIRLSRFLPPRHKFLAIYPIPRVSLIWSISMPSPRKSPPAVAKRWC